MKIKYLLAVIIASQITCSIAGAEENKSLFLPKSHHVAILQAGSLDGSNRDNRLNLFGRLAKHPKRFLKVGIGTHKNADMYSVQKSSLVSCLRLSTTVAAANKLRSPNEPYLPSIDVSIEHTIVNKRSIAVFKCSVTKIPKSSVQQQKPIASK